MSDLKLTIDDELIKKHREYQIDSLLDKNDDSDLKCFILNKVFTKFPEKKNNILKKSSEYDYVEIDVTSGEILSHGDYENEDPWDLIGIDTDDDYEIKF